MNKLIQWIDARFPLISTWKEHASEYYVPKNLNFYYMFGSLAMVVLANQLLTGIWLTMFYTPTVTDAFSSIEYIMRDVNYGWLLRYMHSTGASAFFIVIYIHLYRGLLYGSYKKPRELIWLFGMVLLLLLFAEAFLGYLLPWGQLSYWGAQVMTSMVGAIPYVGDTLMLWVRGDYAVGNATLQRFFALHVIGVPLIILFLVFLHLIALHKVGSNNPEGIEIKNHLDANGKPLDGVPLHPYYTIKDSIAIVVFLIGFFAIVFFAPEMAGYFLEPANFAAANPMVTPDHIAPVWYMAPFYAILRATPDQLGGIILMVSAMLLLLLMPWLDRSPVRSMRYKGRYSHYALVLFVVSFITLGYLGTVDMTPFRQYLARAAAAIYFAYFLLMPFYSRYEHHRDVPTRIAS